MCIYRTDSGSKIDSSSGVASESASSRLSSNLVRSPDAAMSCSYIDHDRRLSTRQPITLQLLVSVLYEKHLVYGLYSFQQGHC